MELTKALSSKQIPVKPKAALYLRVSTIEQRDEGYSIMAQEENCHATAQRMGYEVFKVYSDEGISGKSTKNRPAFQRMMQDASEEKFNVVIIWKLSRLGRNMLEILQTVEKLNKFNIGLFSISEQFDITTSSGRLMLQMLGSFSEFERETIASNVQMTMLSLVRDKKRYAGGRRLGYVSGKKEDGTKLMVIEPEEAKLVQLIYHKYLSGKGYRAIANYLNRLGYKTVKGNNFSTTAVKNILQNYKTYNGYLVYAKYIDWEKKRRKGKNYNPIVVKGEHEPIIDDATAKLVEEKLQLQAIQPKWNERGSNLLTGLLVCPECGAPMAASNVTNTLKDGTKKRIRYYSCSNFRNKGASVCHANSVRADFAEKFVRERLTEIVTVPEILSSLVKNLNEEMQKQVGPLELELANVALERADIEEKIKRWQELILTDPELHDEIVERLSNLRQELSLTIQKENEVSTLLEQKDEKIKYSDISQIVKSLSLMLKDQPKPVIKEIYRTFIEKIQFDKTTKDDFKITMKFNKSIVNDLNDIYSKTVSSNEKEDTAFLCSTRLVKVTV